MTNQVAHLGVILKAAREAAGVSLVEMQRRIFASTTYLCNIEAGRKRVTSEVAEAYDGALGSNGSLLELLAEGDDDMRRAVILKILGSVVGLGVTDLHLISGALRNGLLIELGIDDWQDAVAEHGKLFMTSSASDSRVRLAGDLLLMTNNINRPSVKPALPRLMMLYGMAVSNLGDTGEAARWYRSARLAAEGTQDRQLRVWIRGREAFRRGYEGAAPAEVVRLTDGVAGVEAHLARAQAYAKLSYEQLALASIVDAREALTSADQSEGSMFGVQPWRFALAVAYVYALLGKVKESESEAAQAELPGEMLRWQAQLQLNRAVVLAKSGDRDSAQDLARTVMKALPKDQRSVLLSDMNREVFHA